MYYLANHKTVKLLPIKPKSRISGKIQESLCMVIEPKIEITLVAKKHRDEWRLEIFKVNDGISDL